MNDVRATIQRLTEDLNLLMRQLSAADDAHAREFVDHMLSSEILADFKSSVDAMRHLIWIYVEAVSKSEGSAIVQSARLRRAVDMLRALHSDPVPEQFAAPETFFEHVQSVVDGYGPRIVKKIEAA
jgi:hypothetical protein